MKIFNAYHHQNILQWRSVDIQQHHYKVSQHPCYHDKFHQQYHVVKLRSLQLIILTILIFLTINVASIIILRGFHKLCGISLGLLIDQRLSLIDEMTSLKHCFFPALSEALVFIGVKYMTAAWQTGHFFRLNMIQFVLDRIEPSNSFACITILFDDAQRTPISSCQSNAVCCTESFLLVCR